ncbi:MAG: hypothetical protein L0G99_01640 [Propionibacteriales bacterium]|nr:hypothetical protein [Propionibacteriales bacterium]
MSTTSPPAHESGALVTGAGSRTVDGELIIDGRTVSLGAGTRLGIEVDPARWCLGRRGTDGVALACPDGATVATGRQCARCEANDPWRWLHIVHRSQYPPDAALRKHIMKPHWLYVATFAGGAQKVGTAVDERKRVRLDEQGPIFAHWVGLATDGLQIREWEDLVSRSTSLGQAVRPGVKVAGLTSPMDLAALSRLHQDAVAQTRGVLGDRRQATPISEPWPNPRDPQSLTDLVIRAYPDALDAGRHGFVVQQCWGPVALVRLDGDSESVWAVDLSALIGHRVRFGAFSTAVPQIQDGLF